MSNGQVIIEASARHIHLTREHLEILFGGGSRLTNKRELSQPGQFACEERLRVEGPRGGIDGISILGPERSVTQIEISLTDARILGLHPPIRESGDVKGSAGCTLVGPKGKVDLTEGVIIAKRHIHLRPEDAEAFGVSDKQIVSVKVEGERAVTFGETVVRVSPSFMPRMHIDIDENNAAGISGEVMGTIIS